MTDARPRRPDPHLSRRAVPAGARRHARDRRGRGDDLPRQRRLAGWRIPRRRGVLRHQRLPDHAAAHGRARAARPDRPAAFWGRRARRLLPALLPMLFLLLSYTMLFRASELGKLRGDLVGGPVLRVELVPDLGRPGVHVGQRLRAVAAPLEPRGRGAVLPRLAHRDDADAPARRHPAAGADRRAGWPSRRWSITVAVAAAVPRRQRHRLRHHPRGVLAGRRHGASTRPTCSTCPRSPGPAACSSAPRSRWCGGRGRSCAARCATAAACSMSPPCSASRSSACRCGSSTSSRPAAPTPGCSEAASSSPAIATLMMIAGVTHRFSRHQPRARDAAAAVGRHPLVRPVPVPLADLPGDPQGRREPLSLSQFVVAMVVTCSSPRSSYRLIETPIRKRRFMASIDDLRYRAAGSARVVLQAGVAVVRPAARRRRHPARPRRGRAERGREVDRRGPGGQRLARRNPDPGGGAGEAAAAPTNHTAGHHAAAGPARWPARPPPPRRPPRRRPPPCRRGRSTTSRSVTR